MEKGQGTCLFSLAMDLEGMELSIFYGTKSISAALIPLS